MDINNPKYLEDTFIVRKADADGYDSPDFSELEGVSVLTPEAIDKYFGEYWSKGEGKGSIIYKCTPVFIIGASTILTEIK